MTIVGNYELIARLATGGMAETHVARSLSDGSVVVVKQLLPRYAGNVEFIEMFVDEGRVISTLKHPNVVTMKEFGFHNELPYLAMEYLHGLDLRTLTRTLVLRRKEHVPIDVALFIASSMCAGLHHAHEARTIDGKPMEITHRDVSPQNVVLTFEGAVKLIDFGIATARGRMHETRSGALKGKIPYMSPEQVRASATDRRTDIYATGIVLYEMLSGRRPYVNKSGKIGEFSLMMAIVNHDVVPLEVIQGMPPPLAKVVMRAIASEPKRRYETAEAMRVAIDEVAAQLGVELSAARLKRLLTDVFGEHRTLRQMQTPQVKEMVSLIEGARTSVDETHDPSTIDRLELTPLATTGKLAATDKGIPAFDDIEPEPASDRSSPIVDKIVEANVTRLRFHRQIEPGFRWGRLFDGIEGIVEVDFGGIAELTSPSVTAASEAMRGLGDEVSEIRLIAAPIQLAMELEDRCRVVSVSCRGRCPSCDRLATSVLGYDELRDRLASGAGIPCPACQTGLVEIELGRPSLTPSVPLPVVGSRSSIRMLVAAPVVTTGGQRTVAPPAPTIPPPIKAASSPPPLPRIARTHPVAPVTGKRALIGAAVIGTLAVATIGFTLGRVISRPSATPPAEPAIAPLADDWTVEVEADGTDEAAVASELELRALRAAIVQIESELPGKIRAHGVQPLEQTLLTLDGRPEARFEVRRLTVAFTPGNAIHGRARFAMPAAVRTRLKTYFSQTKKLGAIELIQAPPSRPPGVIVIDAPAGSAVAGDRIVSVGGTPIRDLADIPTSGAEIVIERRDRKTLQERP